jgi:hypothetical protein
VHAIYTNKPRQMREELAKRNGASF